MWRFKHEKEFCPLCYKLYPPEESDENNEGDGEDAEHSLAQSNQVELDLCAAPGVSSGTSDGCAIVVKQEETGNSTGMVTSNSRDYDADKKSKDDEASNTATNCMDIEQRETEKTDVPPNSSSSSSTLCDGALMAKGENEVLQCVPSRGKRGRMRMQKTKPWFSVTNAVDGCMLCARGSTMFNTKL